MEEGKEYNQQTGKMSGIFLLHSYFKYQPKRILCSSSCVCNSLSAPCVLTWRVRNQSPALPSWPSLHPWAHHFTCLHNSVRDTLQQQYAAVLDLGLWIHISELIATKHACSTFRVTSMWSAHLASHLNSVTKLGEKAHSPQTGCWRQVCLCRDASAVLHSERECVTTFSQGHAQKKRNEKKHSAY